MGQCCGSFVRALGTSLAALVTIAAVQGGLLFRRDLGSLMDPPLCSIDRVCLIDNDHLALLNLEVVSPFENVGNQHIAGIYDLSSDQPSFEILCPELNSHRIAAAPLTPWIFIATVEGDLYALDLHVRPRSPIYLGRHHHSHPALLECTEDGSIVIMARLNVTMAWDRATKQLLWRRDDLCSFVPESSRLICGLQNGGVLELDAMSGASLRKVTDHSCPVKGLAVSPRGDSVASMDCDGGLVVTDLVRGCELWSRRMFIQGKAPPWIVRPVFSPSGETLAIGNWASEEVVFVRATDGRLVSSCLPFGPGVQGLAMGRNGTACSWDRGGSVTVWNPDSGLVIGRFSPAQSWFAK